MSINTCLEMFAVRGYTVVYSSDVEIRGLDSKQRIVVLLICPYQKLNVEIVKYYYNYIHLEDIHHFILVHTSTVTKNIVSIIKNITPKRFELYDANLIKFNILKHRFVPKHEKIGHEVENTNQYPCMKRSDAVAKFMDFTKGDIIKIYRHDGSISFRYVTP